MPDQKNVELLISPMSIKIEAWRQKAPREVIVIPVNTQLMFVTSKMLKSMMFHHCVRNEATNSLADLKLRPNNSFMSRMSDFSFEVNEQPSTWGATIKTQS